MVKGQETAENIVSYGTSVSLATSPSGGGGLPVYHAKFPKPQFGREGFHALPW
jgi:hypothetical protein